MSRVYTPLSQVPNVKVGRCSGVLSNHMQCWRAGDVLVTDTTSTPTDTNPEAVTVSNTQLCNRCAVLQQQGESQQARADTDLAVAQAKESAVASKVNTPTPTSTKPLITKSSAT